MAACMCKFRLCLFVCPHLPPDAGRCYPAYWLTRVRSPGVLQFHLCNILSLILLCGFNTEHTGPSWQKPDRVKCWATETKEVRNKTPGNKGAVRQRLKGSWLSTVTDWLEIAIPALPDPCIKWHDEGELEGVVFIFSYGWGVLFSMSLCL